MKNLLQSPKGLLKYAALPRILAGASLVLTVVMVMAVAHTPKQDAAFAQSLSGNNAATARKSMNTPSSNTAGNNGSTAKAGTGSPAGSSTQTTKTSLPGTSASDAPKASQNPAPAPASAPAASPAPSGYPLHTSIKTTYFWAGEAASADNDYIQNVSSAWQTNWQNYFGGSDDPDNRCGYNPCAFTPKENPFYFALPFGDYTTTGPVSDLSMVYWYNSAQPMQSGQSILKNRWIQINALGKTVYAQWEDVGPFNEHDTNYVFGSAAPASTRAGLDVSPAVRDYLGMGGSTTSSWKFVNAADVPDGPWKTTVTASGPDWN